MNITDEQIEVVARAMALHAKWDQWDTAVNITDTLSGNDPEEEREYWRELAAVALSVGAPAVSDPSTDEQAACEKAYDARYVGGERGSGFVMYRHGFVDAYRASQPSEAVPDDSSMPKDMAQAKRWVTQLRARVESLLAVINAPTAAVSATPTQAYGYPGWTRCCDKQPTAEAIYEIRLCAFRNSEVTKALFKDCQWWTPDGSISLDGVPPVGHFDFGWRDLPPVSAAPSGEVERIAKKMAEHAGWSDWDSASSCAHTLSGNEPEEEREFYRELARIAITATKE